MPICMYNSVQAQLCTSCAALLSRHRCTADSRVGSDKSLFMGNVFEDNTSQGFGGEKASDMYRLCLTSQPDCVRNLHAAHCRNFCLNTCCRRHPPRFYQWRLPKNKHHGKQVYGAASGCLLHTYC